MGYQINNRLTIKRGFINRFDNFGVCNQSRKKFFLTILFFHLMNFKSDKERHPNATN